MVFRRSPQGFWSRLGAALEAWAILALGWRRALDLTAAPPDPALPRLVLGGPFARVRHPQSLGLLLMLGGAALGSRSAGVWVAALLAGGLVVAMAVRDDRELARRCRRSIHALPASHSPAAAAAVVPFAPTQLGTGTTGGRGSHGPSTRSGDRAPPRRPGRWRCATSAPRCRSSARQDHSPVTIADREAEQRAVAVLREAFPDTASSARSSASSAGPVRAGSSIRSTAPRASSAAFHSSPP